MDTKALEVRNTFRLLEVRRVVCVLRASTGMLLVRIPVLSQGVAAAASGSVHGSKRSVIASAMVTIMDVQRGTTRTMGTEESGTYNAPDLTPIEVRVRIWQEVSVSAHRHRT